MNSSFRTPSAVLALAALALAGSPSLAGEEPKVDETKVPVIRVIVDHESNLALVPEGTVLPGGFQILSSADLSRADGTDVAGRASSARRPLVFAYAPADRFAGLEAVEIPPDTRGEIVELGFPSEPEVNATKSSNPCPVTIVVEVSPEITHQMTCTYPDYGTGRLYEHFVSYTSFPTTATRSSITMIHDYAPPWTDYSRVTTCFIPSGACTSGSHLFQLPFTHPTDMVSKATIRLPGPCTQDPPYCPYAGTSTIVLPVLMP